MTIRTTPGPQPIPNSYEELFRRSLLLGAVLIFAASIPLSTNAVTDPDIGWHLMTGRWIVEHGAVPQTDPFSAHGQGKPWVAYSWLFEITLYGLYAAMGLSGFIVLTLLLVISISLALMSVIRLVNPEPAVIVGMTSIGLLAMSQLLQTPRPWLFTIFFFTLEIRCLLKSRQTGDIMHLMGLPLIFLLWANLHIQFIYGLYLLGLYLFEPWLTGRLRRFGWAPTTPGHDANTWRIALICVLATWVTPYHLKLYLTVMELMRQTGVYQSISEMKAMDFRSAADWFVLLVSLGVSYLIGEGKERRLLILLLLATGLFLGFRSSREVWFLVVPAVVVIAGRLPHSTPAATGSFTPPQIAVAVMATVLFGCHLARTRHLDPDGLEEALRENYPVTAIYVADLKGLPGPLYNDYDWGGFLIWNLPRLPVSMDGRANLHGDERIERSSRTWNGKSDWMDDPDLKQASLVIGNRDKPLSSLLRQDNKYKVVYEDNTAILFQRESTAAGE